MRRHRSLLFWTAIIIYCSFSLVSSQRCRNTYELTPELWESNKMDSYLDNWSKTHPECNTGSWYRCYARLNGLNNWHCEISVITSCDPNVLCDADPRVYFTLLTISHMATWFGNLYTTLNFAFSQSSLELASLTNTFQIPASDSHRIGKVFLELIFMLIFDIRHPVAKGVGLIGEGALELFLVPPPDPTFINYASFSLQAQDLWKNSLNALNATIGIESLNNFTLFSALAKGGGFLPVPDTNFSIPSLQQQFATQITYKFISLYLRAQEFTIGNASSHLLLSDIPKGDLKKVCSEKGPNWNSYFMDSLEGPETNTGACWFWLRNHRVVYGLVPEGQQFGEVAEKLFSNGRNGKPWIPSVGDFVKNNIDCEKLRKSGPSTQKSIVNVLGVGKPWTTENYLPCIFDIPVCFKLKNGIAGCDDESSPGIMTKPVSALPVLVFTSFWLLFSFVF